jgi:hypothetical protein
MNTYLGAAVFSYNSGHPIIHLLACAIISAGIMLFFTGISVIVAFILSTKVNITTSLIPTAIFTMFMWSGGIKNEK